MIVRTIGQGGMGAVYQARDMRRQTICAIKEMSLSMVPAEERKQAVENFKAEAKMLAGLSHPNLPTFWGFFTEGSRHFLVMEYIDGFTLEEYLERNNAPFPERRVLGWARQLCDVLAYLHSQRPPIIFRDLKPGNIMLTRNGRVKLIDFGIARLFHHSSSHDTQLLGTPGFAPPEQYGKAQTDERSDIYSLAITLFQLMTNTLSEQGFGLTDVQAVNPNISLPVARALEKASALAPEDRYQSVDAFRRALLGEGTFMFENGDQATTAEELAELCARFPEEASDYLFAGEIESWLQEIGDIDLARTAKRLRATDGDPEEAIERFLQAVMGANARIRSSTGKQPISSSQTGTSAVVMDTAPASRNGRALPASSAAEIIVQPLTLDFGEVYPGLSAPLSLAISGYKGAFVQGTLTTKEAWIFIDHTTFDGMSTRVNVQVNTARLRGSTHYSGSIIVMPDDDDEEQDIVVKVEVDVLGGGYEGQPQRDVVNVVNVVSPGDRAPGDRAPLRDEEDEEEDQDLASTWAGGMIMAPPVERDKLGANNARYNEYKAKYGPPGGDSNWAGVAGRHIAAPTGAWDPLQATHQQRLWLQRGVTVFAAFMLASLCYTFLVALGYGVPLPPNPEFIAVLLGCVPCATLGAIIVNWDRTCSYTETLNRLSTGTSTVLLALGLSELAWQSLVHLAVQPVHLVVMLLVAALSATLGTHPQVSTWVIERLIWAMAYIDNFLRWIVIGIAGVVGAMLGFGLTIGFALSWPSFLAALLGCAITLALMFWVDHQLKQHTP